MIAGKLLENAEKLLDMKIHPTIITKGYSIAEKKAREVLEELSTEISIDRDDILKHIVMTAITGKGAENVKEKFADIIVRGIKAISSLFLTSGRFLFFSFVTLPKNIFL